MIDDLTLIEFKVTDKFYGYPDPFMPTGTIVIFIQDKKISISKYHEPTTDEPFPSFTHSNPDLGKNKEIERLLYSQILQDYPQYLSSNESVVLICPSKHLEEIVW